MPNNATKALYYVEISVPQSVRDQYPGQSTFGIQRDLANEFITATGSKNTKIMLATVFGAVKIHEDVDLKGAASITFNNKRNYDTYMAAAVDFRAWVTSTHGVTYDHEVLHDYAYDAGAIGLVDNAEGKTTYNDEAIKRMEITLPRERGFTVEVSETVE